MMPPIDVLVFESCIYLTRISLCLLPVYVLVLVNNMPDDRKTSPLFQTYP